MYEPQGNTVLFVHRPSGESRVAARCDHAQRAAELLNRARYLNDEKRQYTAAARLIATAETLPGFEWRD